MVAVGRRKSRASFLLTLFKVHDSKFWLFFLKLFSGQTGVGGGWGGWMDGVVGWPASRRRWADLQIDDRPSSSMLIGST